MANISIAGHKHREKRNEPVVVVVAFREPVQPDDVAVVEPPQQLHLPVEVPLPRPSSPALARRTVATRPPAKRALYAGDHRREPVGGGLHLLQPEPPHERQSSST
jgi:hypothetical protein